LEVLDYKIQQDRKHLNHVSAEVQKQEARFDILDKQIAVKEKAKATIAEVEAMGHKLPVVPGVHFTDIEAAKLKSLAKKGVGIDKRADEYRSKIAALEGNIRSLNSQIITLKQDISAIARDRDTWKANYERLWGEVKEFIGAIRKIPHLLRKFIAEHLPGKSHNREV
jgi:multidrug resistance efflux pump